MKSEIDIRLAEIQKLIRYVSTQKQYELAIDNGTWKGGSYYPSETVRVYDRVLTHLKGRLLELKLERKNQDEQ